MLIALLLPALTNYSLLFHQNPQVLTLVLSTCVTSVDNTDIDWFLHGTYIIVVETINHKKRQINKPHVILKGDQCYRKYSRVGEGQ
jgi:hypothetical protein